MVLAGVPDKVIGRAKELLRSLRMRILQRRGTGKRGGKPIEGQIDVFAFNAEQRSCDEVLNEIRGIDISTLTPLDALNVLYTLQKKIKN